MMPRTPTLKLTSVSCCLLTLALSQGALAQSVCEAKIQVQARTSVAGSDARAYSHYEAELREDAPCLDAKKGAHVDFVGPGADLGKVDVRVNGAPVLTPGEEVRVELSRESVAMGTRMLMRVQTSASGGGQTSPFACSRVPPKGPSLFWANRRIVVHPTTLDLIDALQWAATQWSTTGCSDIEVIVAEPTTQRWVGYDWSGAKQNLNIVTFRHASGNDFYSEWLHATNQLALTSVTYIASSGEILDADIELNGDAFFETLHDLKNTLTHEMGHLLGLDHPSPTLPGAAQTTMYAESPAGETQKRTLAQGDIDGLCYIYPKGAPTRECYGVERIAPASATILPAVGCNQGHKQSPSNLFFCLLLVSTAGMRRMRRLFLLSL